MLNIESLKIEKHFNKTLKEEVYSLKGVINGTETIIETYETKKEAYAGKELLII